MEQDKCIEEIVTLEEVEVIDNTVDTSQFITKDVDNLIHYTTTNDLENNYVKNEDITDFIKKDVNDLQNYTKTTDLEKDYAKKDEIPDISNFITSEEVNDKLLNKADKNEIPSLENYYTKDEIYSNTEVDDKVDEETRDLLQTLSRELKPNEENGSFSPQTIVSVKNKSGATELIMEIDNLDVKTDVATNSVLGTLKGQDLEDRVKALEEMIELETTMTYDDKTNHIYPNLTIDEEKINKILNSNVSILKVKYNIEQENSNTETDTMIFYTTIDDNISISRSGEKVQTIKINAVRVNDEGTIVYHGELIGNGETYPKETILKATYVHHATSTNAIQSTWG